MIRARIRLDTTKGVDTFVRLLNSDGSAMHYTAEDFEGKQRVNARSFLGMVYASAEFGDYIYLVNETEDGIFPSFVDDFRPLGEDGNSIHN